MYLLEFERTIGFRTTYFQVHIDNINLIYVDENGDRSRLEKFFDIGYQANSVEEVWSEYTKRIEALTQKCQTIIDFHKTFKNLEKTFDKTMSIELE
jgi:hypothetical protein